MGRWSRLNDRQLLVLQCAAAGQVITSAEFPLAATVYALRDRKLLEVRKSGGRWSAHLTQAGRFYLEHGTYDRPRQPPAQEKEAVTRRRRTAGGHPDVPDANGVVAQLHAGGGTLRIPDPDPATRRAWRQAIHVIRQQHLVPDGHHLKATGRDRGDLILRLAAGAHPDQAYRQREKRPPVPVPATADTRHPVLAALRRDPARLDVTPGSLPRALQLASALLKEAERRGHATSLAEDGQPGFGITVGRWTYLLHMEESRAVVEDYPDPDATRVTYEWQRVQPVVTVTGTGNLDVELVSDWRDRGRPRRWGDRQRWRLDTRLADILAEIESRAARDEQQHTDAERRDAERRTQWEQAMAEAHRRVIDARRTAALEDQVGRWEHATRIRAYCQALTAHLNTSSPTAGPDADDLHGAPSEHSPTGPGHPS